MSIETRFKVGDRVVCVRAQSTVAGWQSKIKKGETYTVSAVQKTDWLDGINLAEAPIPNGPAFYSASRFVLAEREQPQKLTR